MFRGTGQGSQWAACFGGRVRGHGGQRVSGGGSGVTVGSVFQGGWVRGHGGQRVSGDGSGVTVGSVFRGRGKGKSFLHSGLAVLFSVDCDFSGWFSLNVKG